LSRPRSGRGVSTTGGVRTAATQRGVYVQAPKSDIFVALLGVALGAMVLGCLLLVLVLNRYGFSTKVSAVTRPSNPAVAFAMVGNPGNSDTVRS
jgi:hypothetical protein